MKKTQRQDRIRALERFRQGESVSTIANSLGYSRRWVYKWIERSRVANPEVPWPEDRSRRPHANPRSCSIEMVEAVKLARLHLYNRGLFCGAQAIVWELEEMGLEDHPSVRTINRILNREELTHRRTGRYESKGRKYPKLPAQGANEVHEMDYVGPCYLQGPIRFYSLNSVDLATGRCALSPVLSKAGQHTLDAIWSSWCRLGIPQNVQVDNELVFYGSRQYPRGMGILIRLCLLNGVEPWFIPMAEPWRNGVVEKFNHHYQNGFLRRVLVRGEKDLHRKSRAFEHKHNTRYRYSKLKGQTPEMALKQCHVRIRFPVSLEAPQYPLPKPEKGRYHLVRFIRSDSEAIYEYVVASIDVGLERLQVQVDGRTIEQYDYSMR